MATAERHEPRSSILPTDPFELALSNLIGLPNGAHTAPTVVQALDFYGNVSRYIIQTVKWEKGNTVFLTQVNTSGVPATNVMLPPEVLAVINRQQDSTTTMVRRRHGQRLAEERKANGSMPGGFTPEMRKKAAATRKAKAAARQARRAKKGVRA